MPTKPTIQPIRSQRNRQVLQRLVARFYKLIALTIFVALVAGSYFLLLKPRYEQIIQDGQSTPAALQLELERRQAYLSNLQELVKSMTDVTQADAVKLAAILPDEEGTANLFIQMEELARQNGFLMNSISVSDGEPVKEMGLIRRMTITVQLTGLGYTNLKALLSSIEHNIRIMDVEAVYFTPDSPLYSITLHTYYFPQSQLASDS